MIQVRLLAPELKNGGICWREVAVSTYLENLTTARDNVAAILAEITENPKPSYSIGGQSVSWESYFATLTRQLEDLDRAIQRANGPYQKSHRGRT